MRSNDQRSPTQSTRITRTFSVCWSWTFALTQRERDVYRSFPGKSPRGDFFFRHFQPRLAGKKKSILSHSPFVKNKENQGFSNKAKWGTGFVPLFSVEACRQKNPTPWGFSWRTLVVLGMICLQLLARTGRFTRYPLSVHMLLKFETRAAILGRNQRYAHKYFGNHLNNGNRYDFKSPNLFFDVFSMGE